MTFASPILFILNVLTVKVQKHSSLEENASIFEQLKYFLKKMLEMQHRIGNLLFQILSRKELAI